MRMASFGDTVPRDWVGFGVYSALFSCRIPFCALRGPLDLILTPGSLTH